MAMQRLRHQRDWHVAEGSTDIRGWRVYDAAGQKVGVIADLLFEPATGEVRQAVVDLWDRRATLPVVDLVAEADERRVVARGYDRARFDALPAFDAKAQEADARDPYARSGMREDAPRERVAKDGPQTIRLLAEELEIGKKRTRVGEVTITKTPVVEWLEEALELGHEELDIRHEAVDLPATGQEKIEVDGDVIRIPVIGEKVVIERRPVVKEIITIRKRPAVEKVTIREAVRHEEVTFDGLPPGTGRSGRP